MKLLKCNGCKCELPVDSFTVSNNCTRGYQYKCRACMKKVNSTEEVRAKKREAVKEWRKSNPEKRAEQKKRHYEKYKDTYLARSKTHYAVNKEQHTDKRLQRKYGISLEEYNNLRLEQKYCCALCGKHEDDNKQGLVIDHCHKSGDVRKLLCTACNVGLGMFQDNTELLAKAIEYLKAHRE